MSHDDGRLPEEIRYVKFSSITWTHDSKGFFYQVWQNFDYIVESLRADLIRIAFPGAGVSWLRYRRSRR